MLKCEMCLFDRQPSSPEERFLSARKAAELLARLPSSFTVVAVQGYGEPLLNPELGEMIRLCREKWPRARIMFNTNGLLLGRCARSIMQSGVDHIDVSVNSADPAQFAALKSGASFDEVVANIGEFIRCRREMKQETPTLGFRCVVTRGVDYHKLIDLAATVEVSLVTFQELWVKDGAQTNVAQSKPGAGEMARLKSDITAHAGRRKMPVEFVMPSVPGEAGCVAPWHDISVLINGAVMPCCFLYLPEGAGLGNCATEDVMQIWNGPAYRSFRRDFIGGQCALCLQCDHYRRWRRP